MEEMCYIMEETGASRKGKRNSLTGEKRGESMKFIRQIL